VNQLLRIPSCVPLPNWQPEERNRVIFTPTPTVFTLEPRAQPKIPTPIIPITESSGLIGSETAYFLHDKIFDIVGIDNYSCSTVDADFPEWR